MYAFGSGVLQGFRTDIATQTPVNFGLIQEVTVDWSFDLKELYGQYQTPLALGRGKAKIACKAKLARISGLAFGSLFFGINAVAGMLATSFGEAQTITAGAATATQGTLFVDDLGVIYSVTGLPLTKVATAPLVGQYSLNPATGVFAFHTSDNTKGVLLNYTYTLAATGEQITVVNQLMGQQSTFQANLYTSYQNLQVTLKLPNCVSNKLAFPTKLDDFTMPEFDFSIFANAANVVGYWNFQEAS